MSSIHIDAITPENILQFFDDPSVSGFDPKMQQQVMHTVGVQLRHV